MKITKIISITPGGKKAWVQLENGQVIKKKVSQLENVLVENPPKDIYHPIPYMPETPTQAAIQMRDVIMYFKGERYSEADAWNMSGAQHRSIFNQSNRSDLIEWMSKVADAGGMKYLITNQKVEEEYGEQLKEIEKYAEDYPKAD